MIDQFIHSMIEELKKLSAHKQAFVLNFVVLFFAWYIFMFEIDAKEYIKGDFLVRAGICTAHSLLAMVFAAAFTVILEKNKGITELYYSIPVSCSLTMVAISIGFEKKDLWLASKILFSSPLLLALVTCVILSNRFYKKKKLKAKQEVVK